MDNAINANVVIVKLGVKNNTAVTCPSDLNTPAITPDGTWDAYLTVFSNCSLFMHSCKCSSSPH